MAVLLTKGEIRCYCDAPHCVATGYMCKSELNACFTRVLDPLSVGSPLTHGCLDPASDATEVCTPPPALEDVLAAAVVAAGAAGPPSSPFSSSSFSAAATECCHDDMCNYRGLHDVGHTRDSTDIKRFTAIPCLCEHQHLISWTWGILSPVHPLTIAF